MKLDAPLRRQVYAALLNAFPTEAALGRMLTLGMDMSLARVAGNGSLSDQTMEVIVWAESQDRVEELMRAAQAENPGNRDLKAAAVELEKLRLGLDPELFTRIAVTLLSCVVHRAELAMMVAVCANRSLEEISTSGSLRTDVERVLVVARREGWLTDLLGHVVEERPARPELKELLDTVKALPPAAR